MIEIAILGQRYLVPEELTILRAFEWAGFHVVRGVGCRGGFCGACGTVYRLADDYHLYYALACQTLVKPGMILSQIPFFPARRPAYHLDQIDLDGETMLRYYPELLRCFGCNTCSKACPQELDVLGYMAAAFRGDLAAAADGSFDCIMCGLCVARCPAEAVPPNVGLLARRLYGKYMAPRAEHLKRRVEEIEAGKYQNELVELESLPLAELRKRYEARQIET
jgi:ferredoxin